ncbi:MAG TPA: cell division protein [Firmicutes bacterium]|nr:cell division protein [Bacillota bacterium]
MYLKDVSSVSDHEIRFSLDIGTRSVIGLVTRPSAAGLDVLACERIEHQSRAMLDGQIHNIPEVAAVIKEIKQRLESVCGPLTSASVAAAGRALCTITTHVDQEVTSLTPLKPEDIRRSEIAAVQAAQKQIAQGSVVEDPAAYYCVGYSVVNYFLDNNIIASLEGQKGKSVGIELIATFLPRVVIESLQSALSLADLDIHSLTLEPIAAINVLIPSTMRHLNLALVDVGAGTSDIAITSKGTVVAFGMVPCAGDEITEALSHHYLLDFNVAEQVKRQLHQANVTFSDVLGFTHTKDTAEIISIINIDVNSLAETISQQISSLNGRFPQAVLLIGGGSLTPELAPAIARLLNLPPERVGIREAKSIQGFNSLPEYLHGPDGITPLGITKTAHSQTLNFIHITINESSLRLFNFGSVTVGDALLATGLNIRDFHGKPGMGLSVTINQKPHFLPGTFGQPPAILVNGQPASLDTALNNADTLILTRGEDGQNAAGTLADVLPKLKSLSVMFNKQYVSVKPVVKVNGNVVDLLLPLTDGMQVTVQEPRTLQDITTILKTPPPSANIPVYTFTVNGVSRSYSAEYVICINGSPASHSDPVHEGDEIDCPTPVEASPLLGDVLNLDGAVNKNITVLVNGQPLIIELEKITLSMNGSPATPTTPLINGADIIFEHSSQPVPIVSELLLQYEDEILPQIKQGGRLNLTLNGATANYAAPLKNGDRLDWSWKGA